MFEREKDLSTEQKALTINLDDRKYGTIVEIARVRKLPDSFLRPAQQPEPWQKPCPPTICGLATKFTVMLDVM